MKTGILVGLMVWGLSFTAGAEKSEKGEVVVHEQSREVVRRTTTIDFNDTELSGDLARPEGDYVPAREASQFDSLLKPRADFLPELEKSAEGL